MEHTPRLEEFVENSLQEIRQFIQMLRMREESASGQHLFLAIGRFTGVFQRECSRLEFPDCASLAANLQEACSGPSPDRDQVLGILETLYTCVNMFQRSAAAPGARAEPVIAGETGLLVMARDQSLIEQMERFGREHHFAVFNCQTQPEAEELLQNCRIDLVFLHPPSLSGNAFQICSRLKKKDSSLSIYISQDNHTIFDQIQCIRMGGDGFVGFPLEPLHITEILYKIGVRQRLITPKILWIDDDINFTRIFSKILQRAGFEVFISDDPLDVFNLLYQHRPDALILDYDMPAANGLEITRMIRLNQEFRLLPIIVLSAVTDSSIRRLTMDARADDFISKPLETTDFIARIRAKIERADLLKTLSDRDPLTDLFNHRAFQEHLARECTRAARYGHRFTVGLADVDGFTAINERYSYLRGDQILQKIAAFCQRRFRKSDILGRFGADEIAVILLETGKDTARSVMTAVLDHIKEMSFLGDDPQTYIRVTLSAGLASFPEDGGSPRQLLAHARSALQSARLAGPGSI